MGSVRILIRLRASELMHTQITAVLTGNNPQLCHFVSHLQLYRMYLEESFKNISYFSDMIVQWKVRKSWDSTLATSYLATSGTSYFRRYKYVRVCTQTWNEPMNSCSPPGKAVSKLPIQLIRADQSACRLDLSLSPHHVNHFLLFSGACPIYSLYHS